jgi:CubicO group peptidase (beta-lactamase class C family)
MLAAGYAGLLASGRAFPCGGGFGTGIQINPQQDIILVW